MSNEKTLQELESRRAEIETAIESTRSKRDDLQVKIRSKEKTELSGAAEYAVRDRRADDAALANLEKEIGVLTERLDIVSELIAEEQTAIKARAIQALEGKMRDASKKATELHEKHKAAMDALFSTGFEIERLRDEHDRHALERSRLLGTGDPLPFSLKRVNFDLALRIRNARVPAGERRSETRVPFFKGPGESILGQDIDPASGPSILTSAA